MFLILSRARPDHSQLDGEADRTLSRKHANVYVSATPKSGGDRRRPGVEIEVLGKFGCVLDGKKGIGGQVLTVSPDADRVPVLFGRTTDRVLRWRPLVLCVHKDAKVAVSKSASDLGALVYATWRRDSSTHYVVHEGAPVPWTKKAQQHPSVSPTDLAAAAASGSGDAGAARTLEWLLDLEAERDDGMGRGAGPGTAATRRQAPATHAAGGEAVNESDLAPIHGEPRATAGDDAAFIRDQEREDADAEPKAGDPLLPPAPLVETHNIPLPDDDGEGANENCGACGPIRGDDFKAFRRRGTGRSGGAAPPPPPCFTPVRWDTVEGRVPDPADVVEHRRRAAAKRKELEQLFERAGGPGAGRQRRTR